MKIKSGSILIVDDDEDVLFSARLLLKQQYSVVRTEKNPRVIPSILKNDRYDVILLDMNFSTNSTSGVEGFDLLKQILELDSSAIVILMTAFGNIETAVNAIKEGATDFVLKPWQNEKLLATVSSALKLSESRQKVSSLLSRQRQLSQDIDKEFHHIIGVSTEMQEVFSAIKRVAKTDANVLIIGENGTGKELVARAIHRKSSRSNEIFLAVDMGTIGESLFESEMFGYVKGAFTDAKEDRAGRFEVASGGTLFLDEIGNLSNNLQMKLLRVLQNRQITRLGSNIPKTINIRLICATNLTEEELFSDQKFRKDLLYRINTVEIILPPLRKRANDIPLLAEHFLNVYCNRYDKPKKILSQQVLDRFRNYQWPGNVREMQHMIERVVIMSDSKILQADDFHFSSQYSVEEDIGLNSYNLYEAEKLLIKKAIGKHGGNLTKAAKELGLTRTSLYRRLEKYGL